VASYSITNRAEADLKRILIFGYERFGERQGDRYAEELEEVFQRLAHHPRMGRPASNFGPNVRRHEHEAHVILYEETEEGVSILAVVHAAGMHSARL
jgi:toxin ParE1/3/4